MFKKIKKAIKTFILRIGYSNCYTEHEYTGFASMGLCSGIYDEKTGYKWITAKCAACPYFADPTGIVEYTKKDVELTTKAWNAINEKKM